MRWPQDDGFFTQNILDKKEEHEQCRKLSGKKGKVTSWSTKRLHMKEFKHKIAHFLSTML